MLSLRANLLIAICFSLSAVNAQSDLVFNKRFVESEDKWVAFRPDSIGSYSFGFIYIDAMAGLTLEYVGNFTIGEDGGFRLKPVMDTLMGSVKVRLQNKNVKVALIPETRFEELKIKAVPDWLHFYKDHTDTAKRLQRWGYYYNDWGMSKKALEYLEPGYKMDPNFEGMAVELAFAYNAIEKFDKAIPVLLKVAELTPKEGYVYKELSYAYLKTGNLEKAGEAARNGIKYYDDVKMKAEIAYNMAFTCFEKKDKANFHKWVEEARKWVVKDDRYYRSIIAMEKKLNE